MLEWIESSDDVLAFKVSGKIAGADLTSIMSRLEQAMDSHPKVHIFVETSAIDAIEISALPGYAARAMPLLGKLTHFGRVAVVADQLWVRLATRLESAMLPFVSYRTFAPDERDKALGWVMGRSSAQESPVPNRPADR